MSAIEEADGIKPVNLAKVGKSQTSFFARFLHFACSVRLGVSLLITLALACMIGMLVMQQNVQGFENYFAALTPAQRLVYGRLGFFNIYYAWYFNALLCALSLNIILATIDRFPKIWPFASRPSVTVPKRWLADQDQNSSLIVRGDEQAIESGIARAMKRTGFGEAKYAEKNGRKFIFGQSGLWNRFAFCSVHVGLLTIFLGGFLTAQLGNTGNLPLTPGQTSDLILDTAYDLDNVTQITKKLPFEVTCIDIQQKLIRDDGSLSPNNTIDWLTYFTIKDETGIHEGFVQMNRPFDFRGYRFFQASFTSIGRARTISLEVTPESGGSSQVIELPRAGSAELADGTKVIFSEFRGNFRIGPENPNEDTSNYENPAAVLQVFPPGEVLQTATAFGPEVGDIPVANKAVGGYKFKLLDYEKVADQHILSVQRDPGANVVYIGFALLSLTLIGTFFFSHKRVWAVIEAGPDGTHEITLAGNTNRNRSGFDEKFKELEKAVSEEIKESHQ